MVSVESVSSSRARTITLDDLAARSYADLDALYRAGSVPASMHAVDGPLVGRMLRVRAVTESPLGELLRSFAGSKAFVWEGKTFAAEADSWGAGINRVVVPGVLGRQNLFPFHTRFDTSAIDGRRAIVLDYDRSENPPYIRKIHDEVRHVGSGVYLGPAMWKAAAGPTMVLWFALDTGRAG